MAAVAAIPVKTVGLTPTAIGVWTLVAGLALAMIKIWPALRKLANEAAIIRREADASLRTDLLGRVKELEAGQTQMLKDHTNEILSIKNEHAAEMSDLRKEMHERDRKCNEEQAALRIQMEGLMNIIRQFGVSSGHVVELSPQATAAAERVAKIEQEKGKP